MARSERKRARTADRDQAVDLINTGYADGRLTAVEREHRVERALAAKTLGDLAQVTTDLQPDTVPTSSREKEGWWQRTSGRTKLAVAAAALAVVGGGVTASEVLGDDDTVVMGTQTSYAAPVTAESVEALIADQEAEFGTTKSYGMSLQTELTALSVPTDDGRARYRVWHPREEGGFEPAGEVRGAGEYLELDLGDVDLAALGKNIEEAQSSLEVPGPTRLTLVIQHWSHDEEARITVTVSNEYEEYGYVVTDLAGAELDRRPFQPGG